MVEVLESIFGKSPKRELGIGVAMIAPSRAISATHFTWPEIPLLLAITMNESGAIVSAKHSIIKLARLPESGTRPDLTSVKRNHRKAAQMRYTCTNVYSPERYGNNKQQSVIAMN